MAGRSSWGLAAAVAAAALLAASATGWLPQDEDADNDLLPHEQRSHRFFPFLPVVRFANRQCAADNGLNGTCFTRRECSNYGGIASGTCANSLGCCCVIIRSCGTSSRINCTYFVNPNYPATYTGGTRCTITINKCNSNVCQVRLDFIDFSLAQPDANGNCVDDAFTVSGAASIVPRICGENTGQHIYVDFEAGNTPLQLSVDATTTNTFGRRWNIKVTQIECDSVNRAPTGCLMYYTSTTGTVKSFNYGTTANPAADVTLAGTRELVNLNYGVCVQMQPGYCCIEWSQNPADPYSFTVSGDTGGLDNTLLGQPAAALNDGACTGDFIVIPNPSQNGVPVNTDRFCGNALITTTTCSKPFVMTVVTDAGEQGNVAAGINPDNENRGFCLFFRQIPFTVDSS
ncbi:uncharacterized protein LOC124774927 [Schistocerca piceifrons]|uniref:uncharacterized protein LOC124774927 n=1 Tax=Schistocerca piceifrons TaxID=274613 RepID=UPI001F5E5ACE|nr:uncharacterized protein LOC124774927 [Schistocerca piceifrons]